MVFIMFINLVTVDIFAGKKFGISFSLKLVTRRVSKTEWSLK